MMIQSQKLKDISNGFNAAFMVGLEAAKTDYEQLVMHINSTGSGENYGFLKDLPGMREWVGQRVIHNLEMTAAFVKNKDWEHTIGVDANDINDNKLGAYSLVFKQQGEIAALHPADVVWQLLSDGFTGKGFDGQPFFDADHVTYTRNRKEVSWSNVLTGNSAPWFLLDLSRQYMRPLAFQRRQAVQFVAKNKPDDESVFMERQYLYGAHARYTGTYGYYQLAFGSTAPLTPENYEIARRALASQCRPDGAPLAVKATHLAVGSSNEAAGLKILKAESNADGSTNIWRDTASLLVSPWLE